MMKSTKAMKEYEKIKALYCTAAFIQLVIIIFLFLECIYKVIDIFKAFEDSGKILYEGIDLLPYLPAVFVIILSVFVFMLISLILLLMPLFFNDLCKKRNLNFSKFGAAYSLFYYFAISFVRKDAGDYIVIFHIDAAFCLCVILHTAFFLLVTVIAVKSRNINNKIINVC